MLTGATRYTTMPEGLYRWKCIKDRMRALTVLSTALERSDKFYLGISTTNVPFIDADRKGGICGETLREFTRWVSRILKCRVAVLETDRGYHIVPLTTLVNESKMYEEIGGEIGRVMSEITALLSRYAGYYVVERARLRPEDVVRETEIYARLRSRVPIREMPRLRSLESRLAELIVQRNIVRIKMREGRFYVGGRPTFEEFYRTIVRLAEMGDVRYPHIRFIVYCIDMNHVEMSIKYHRTTLRISGKPCKPYDIKLLFIQ